MKNWIVIALLAVSSVSFAQRIDIQRLRPLPGDSTHVMGYIDGKWSPISIEDIIYSVEASQITPAPSDSTKVLAYKDGEWGPVSMDSVKHTDLNGIISAYPSNTVTIEKTTGGPLHFKIGYWPTDAKTNSDPRGRWYVEGAAILNTAYHSSTWRSEASFGYGNGPINLRSIENCNVSCQTGINFTKARVSTVGDTLKPCANGDMIARLRFAAYGPGTNGYDSNNVQITAIEAFVDSISTTAQFGSMSFRVKPYGNTGGYFGEEALKMAVNKSIVLPWYGTGARTTTSLNKTDSGYVAKFATDGTIIENTAARWFNGAGSPEGVVTAPPGSLYTNTSGGTGATLYVKETGTGNTGWVVK